MDNKYLNLFSSLSEQQKVYSAHTYDMSYVDYTIENNTVHYAQPFFHSVGKVGDFYYENGLYSTDVDLTQGTPIGIMVIEKDFIPTSPKGRVMSLLEMSCSSPTSGSTSYQSMCWGNYGVDTTLPNLTSVVHGGTGTTALSTAQGVKGYAYLPSDKFTTLQYSGDPSTYYYYQDSDGHAISPYLTDSDGNTTFNTEYIKTTSPSSSANCLSDLDGYGNTEVLTNDTYTSGQSDWKTASAITNNSGAGYSPAACCCKRFEVGRLDWYLPSMGELGFIMPRFNVIQNQLTKLRNHGGTSFSSLLDSIYRYWSSSEHSSYHARNLYAGNGYVYGSGYFKSYGFYVRAFSLV